MTPKGGIRPHKRFSIQAKRSEVLFVDYMAEHLTPNGRAGIIVPEGIIFKSDNAYKQLRRMLLENYLIAVVSVPAGVFLPYSNVKTSILILDKSLSKRTDRVAFFKIEADGFDLGTQRQPIERSDLPNALAELREYRRRLATGESLDQFEPTLGLIVERTVVAANRKCDFSGEKYRKAQTRAHQFPLVKLGDVCTLNPSKRAIQDLGSDTLVSFVPMADLNENRIDFQPTEQRQLSEVGSSYTYFQNEDVLVAKVTPCFENGKAGIARRLTNGVGFGSSEFYVLRPTGQVLPEWIYFCVMHPFFRVGAISQMTGTGGLQRVPKDYVYDFEIPLPPLEVQQEIVTEIEGHQKLIEDARRQICLIEQEIQTTLARVWGVDNPGE